METKPKRYLIHSYFEPRVSDRSVSYLQVTQFYIVKREAAPFRRGDIQLIWSVKPTQYNGPVSGSGGDRGIRNPDKCVTGTRDNHFTTPPEKDATYFWLGSRQTYTLSQ